MDDRKLRRYFRHGTLTQMRVFEAVARLGNFTRAGEELHMAQPTVSVHMKKLAETVGAPLIEQTGKRIRLSPAGNEVREACMRVFRSLSELDDALADISGLKAGRLRIAATTAGERLLPQLLARFVGRHPGIDVSLHVSSRQAILERIAHARDDLYLLTRLPETPALAAHAIAPNPLIALAGSGHPLAGERGIAFERFAREPLLVREPGSGTRLAVEEAFEQRRLKPVVRMELGSNESIKEAVIAGLGVAILYRSALGLEPDRRLALLDVETLPHDRHWHLAHPAGQKLACVAQTFLEFARMEAREPRHSCADTS